MEQEVSQFGTFPVPNQLKKIFLGDITMEKMNGYNRIITVAVCDDDKYVLEKLERDCRSYFEEKGLELQMYVADSGEKMLFKCKGEEINLAFIDIEMPEMSGFELADYLRLCVRMERLVFVTNKDDLVHESINYQPFGFVRKSRWEEELLRTLNRFYKELLRNEAKITVHFQKKELMDIFVCEIRYIEINSHTLSIYRKDSIIRIRETMRSIEERLREHYFIRIHQGYLVNARYIQKFEDNDCVLVDGERLPVSRHKKEAVRKQYMDYIRKCG